jgi:hypothetical protein
LNTIHQDHDGDGHFILKLDLKDVNFGIDDGMYTYANPKNTGGKLQHRILRKSSKTSKKTSKSEKTSSVDDTHDSYSSDDIAYPSQKSHSSKATKKSNQHAGFMDEDIVEDFEEMFGPIISADFSMESKSSKSSKNSGTKSSKKSETKSSKKSSSKLKQSKKARPKQSKDSKSRKPNRSKQSIPKLSIPPVGKYLIV